MKKLLLLTSLLIYSFQVNAQEFNKWTVEANFGQAKGIRPYQKGYYSSDAGTFLGKPELNAFSIGARRMLSPMFGFKAGFHYENLSNLKSNGSLPFEMQQIGFSLQAVINGTKLFKIEKEMKRFGLLFHGGIKVDQMTSKTENVVENDQNNGITEYNGGFVLGFTPQYRIAKRWSLMLDFSFQANYRQHFNWDGSYSDGNNNLNGAMTSTTLGLSYSFGKNDIHGDWAVIEENKEELKAEMEALQKRIGDIETLMNDTDKDGVADYIDQENNSVAGVAVDSRGKMVDQNRNGVPDELERYITNNSKETTERVNADAVKRLINEGYISTYFDTNKTQPTNVSTEGIDFIRTYLRNNPTASVEVFGHADEIGSSEKNSNLAKARAEAVKGILVKSGIDAGRINIISKGEDTSVDKDSEGARRLVRRVTFKVKE